MHGLRVLSGLPRLAWSGVVAGVVAAVAVPSVARAEEEPSSSSAPPPAPPSVAAAAVAPAPLTTPPPSPAVPAPATTPAPAPAAKARPATPPAPAGPKPGHAVVHIGSSHADAWLETRSRVDADEWQRACAAPCDREIRVEGLEMRVTAPGMTTSNAFVIEPGPGTARLRVAGGSDTARTLGVVGLTAGLPVAFGGMALFGLGSVKENPAMRTTGIVVLSVGAVAVLASLPLLLVGGTSVKNAKGRNIAAVEALSRLGRW